MFSLKKITSEINWFQPILIDFNTYVHITLKRKIKYFRGCSLPLPPNLSAIIKRLLKFIYHNSQSNLSNGSNVLFIYLINLTCLFRAINLNIFSIHVDFLLTWTPIQIRSKINLHQIC